MFRHTLAPKKRQYDIWVCIGLFVMAIALRAWHIGDTDIGSDECFSLYYSQFSIGEIIRILCQGDNPPLWEILLHGWTGIFGIEVVPMRVLSMLFNVLTIIPLFLLGKHLSGSILGIVTAALFSLSTFSVFLSHEGRVYCLVGMLAAWSALLFLQLIEKPDKAKWVAWVIVNVLIIYGHYMAIWVVVMQTTLWIAVTPIRKRLGLNMLYALLVLALLYLPIVPTLFWRFSESGMHGTWVSRCHGLEDLYSMICCFTNAPVTAVLAITLMVAALIKFLVRIIKKKFIIGPLMIVTLMWVVPLLVSFGLSFIVGFFLNRYFYFLMPIYLLSLSAYVQYLFPKQKVPSAALTVLLVVAMAASLKPDSSKLRYAGWKGDVSAVVQRMKTIKEENDALVIINPEWIDKQLAYYIDDNHETFRTQGSLSDPAFCCYFIKHGYIYEHLLGETYLHDNPTIVIVHNNYQDISPIIQCLDTQGYQQSRTEVFLQMSLTLYAKVSTPII